MLLEPEFLYLVNLINVWARILAATASTDTDDSVWRFGEGLRSGGGAACWGVGDAARRGVLS